MIRGGITQIKMFNADFFDELSTKTVSLMLLWLRPLYCINWLTQEWTLIPIMQQNVLYITYKEIFYNTKVFYMVCNIDFSTYSVHSSYLIHHSSNNGDIVPMGSWEIPGNWLNIRYMCKYPLPVEVCWVPALGFTGLQGDLSRPHFAHRSLEHGHDITETNTDKQT